MLECTLEQISWNEYLEINVIHGLQHKREYKILKLYQDVFIVARVERLLITAPSQSYLAFTGVCRQTRASASAASRNLLE